MKKLEDFAGDINKCSKCGLCQSVCPVYKLTGNDCAVSRGKFVMLDGVLKGDLKLNRNIEKYLDLCLKCGKCTNFCPSSINVCDIFNTAKYECAKNTFHGRFEEFLESKFVFGNILNFFRKFPLIRRSVSFCTKQRQASLSANSVCYPHNGKGCLKLLYFKGCVNEAYPKVENALKTILAHLDVELIERNFECCGLPFLSSGNMKRFEEVKNRNLELMNCEYDYILTDCASCEHTLKSYGCKNVRNALDFIAEQNIKFSFKSHKKVTFHKPCHLESDKFLRPLLKKCENVEYIEMNGYDECCGFAGEFALKNSKISREISKKKAENAALTGADVLLTLCPACIMGLHQGFIFSRKKAPPIKNLVEFLSEAEISVF